MKKIKIIRLTLENFKCHDALTLDFLGENVGIRGDNATGKTSIYDALTWLLFGKDSKGNGEKSIDIKPLNADGSVKDHAALTAVEAMLDVDGAAMSVKRTLREIWSTKRGSSEASYDGNTSDYFIDGVPMKKKEFDRRIGEVVGEDAFRMLTSIRYFADELPWKERRKVLFDISGAMSDRDIMLTEERFLPLMQQTGHITVDDLKKKVAAEKKGLLGIRDTTPAKLATLMDLERELRGNDFEAARAELTALTSEKENLMQQLSDIQQNAALISKEKEIGELLLQKKDLDAENMAYRSEQKRKQPDISGIEMEISRLKKEISVCETEIQRLLSSISTYETGIADARARWIRVNDEAFTGGICPTCGQSLPMEQLKSATDDFDRRKKERLTEIETTANNLKASQAAAEDRISELREKIENDGDVISNLEKAAAEARKTAHDPEDMPEYASKSSDIVQQITVLRTQKESIIADSASVADGLREKLREVNAKISECNAVLGKEQTLSSVIEKIRILREDAERAASQLEGLEKTLFLIEDFIRYKTSFVENSINGLFRIVAFRLFREQANDGVEERCDVTYNGIPYASLNSGAKINVGIDIINTLSKHYGISVPLFIDNAESVTHLEGTDTQVIRLIVSEEDKELRCQYEN